MIAGSADDDVRRILRQLERRTFLRRAAAGTVIVALGGAAYLISRDEVTERARRERLPDGRSRLPPEQRVISALCPMGGEAGDPSPSKLRLRVCGAVEQPFELDLAGLSALPRVEQRSDVHCVTGWSVLDAVWTGVRVATLAERARPRPSARHVLFEAAFGYTANVPIAEALAPDVLVAHRLNGEPLSRANGAPLRAVVPGLYFWKSAKWLRTIRFVEQDRPGFWEVRGYHNHGDPWREESYA
jgi:DMSO/TMAO reductase YedYZ molybdopterin-dependent catalytic subunit